MLLSVIQLSTRCLRGLKVANVTSKNTYNQVQKYSRFASRRPVAIVNEDELHDVEEAAYRIKDEKPKRRSGKFARNGKISKNNYKNLNEEEEKEEEVDYSEGKRSQTTPKPFTKKRKGRSQSNVETKIKNFSTKLYGNEKLLSNLMLEIKSRKKRKSHNKILLEGTRLIADAIQAGEIPEMVIFSNPAELKKLSLPEDKTKVFKVPYRSIQLWSSLTTPPGIMGVFKTPDIENYVSMDALPITLICDNVRDPGNMGSILRAAAGVGCEKVILTKGCVDLWESKVLRSAAGAHFRLPIYGYKEWEEIRPLVSNNAQIIVADNKSAVQELFENENESEEIEQISNIEEENIEVDRKSHSNRNYEKIDLSEEIPVVPYFSIDYTQGETVIIIGGETEGLSEESFRLVDNSQGVRVNVPLNNKVESLNSAMALGVIAFEIKRQFLIAANKAVNQTNSVVDENGDPPMNEGGGVHRKINEATPSSENDASPSYVNEQQFQRFMNQLLRNQEEIKREITQMKSASNLTTKRVKRNIDLFTEPILKKLPYQTIADVDHLNNRLTDKEFQKIASVNQTNSVVDENGDPPMNEGEGVHRKINEATPSSENDASPSYVNEQQFQRFMNQLLRNQEEIKREITQMKSASNFTTQRVKWNIDLFAEPILRKLPYQTIADVDHLNNRLADKEFQKIAYDAFDSIGGRNLKDSVYRILKKIFSNQLAVKCIWCNRDKNKVALSTRQNITLMILRIMRKQYGKEIRECDLKPYYIQWLKNEKKRRKREIANAELIGLADQRHENNLETDDDDE